MKKCIKIFLIILLVCIIGSVIVLIIRNNNKLSIEEIKSLLDKGKSISNVYFEHTVLEQNEEEYTMKKYLKDDTYVFEIDNSYQWINFSTDEWIYIDNTNKTISVTDTKNCDKFNDYSYYFEELINNGYEYKYIKLENVNQADYHVIEIKKEDVGKVKFWINCENGVVEKKEEYNSLGNLVSTNKYKYIYNIVTEEEIKKPDFLEYEEYKILK